MCKLFISRLHFNRYSYGNLFSGWFYKVLNKFLFSFFTFFFRLFVRSLKHLWYSDLYKIFIKRIWYVLYNFVYTFTCCEDSFQTRNKMYVGGCCVIKLNIFYFIITWRNSNLYIGLNICNTLFFLKYHWCKKDVL